MERKFTDDEIVKALEICAKSECWGDCEDMGCPATTKQGCAFYLRTDEDYEGVIQTEMLKDALDLINRKKAEIERLEKTLTEQFDSYESIRKRAKAEAIKEFAEKLKAKAMLQHGGVTVVYGYDIDKLVKEMTGGKT